MRGIFLALVFIAAGSAGSMNAKDIPWPKGYTPECTSPDEHYAVLTPDRHQFVKGSDIDWDAFDKVSETNYLADLKSHRVLCSITGFQYLNRGGPVAEWATDDSWCVIGYVEKWGGACQIKLVQIDGGKATLTDLGERIFKEVDPLADVSLHIHSAAENGILEIRGYGTTDPKGVEGDKARQARMRALYNLKDRKWISVKAEKLSAVEYGVMDDERDFDDRNPPSENEEGDDSPEALHRYMDGWLNETYTALKHRASAEEFAALRDEQRDWLTHADKDLKVENQRLFHRINVLQFLLRKELLKPW